MTKPMRVQVKGGHVKVGDVRDLVGTLSREGARGNRGTDTTLRSRREVDNRVECAENCLAWLP